MVWTAAATALVALPLLSVALPTLRVPLANALLPADQGIVSRATAATAAGQAAAGGTGARPALARGIDGKVALMLLWMVGIAGGLLQMLAATALLWRTRRAARVSPDQGTADALAWSLGIEHPVEVLVPVAVQARIEIDFRLL